MQTVKEILKDLPMILNESMERISNMTEIEREQFLTDCANAREGELNLEDGYDCRKCKNKGIIYIRMKEPPYREIAKQCSCMKARRSIRRMKASGLEPLISRYTLDRYEANEDWQKAIKEKANAFLANVDSLDDKWFFMGGGVGTGKTHICTAIAVEMLRRKKEVRYMLWVDEVKRIKALANDDLGADLVDELKHVEVLYIDDLFKPVGRQEASAADIKLAYEIVNYRYLHPELITIISSELHIMEIEELDSALGSRIYEKTKSFALNIAKLKDRNYRMRPEMVI